MKRMIRAAALAAAFLSLSMTFAADPLPAPAAKKTSAKLMKASGDTITVKPGDFADFAIDVPEGTSVLSEIIPEPPKIAEGLPNGRFIFSGIPATKYTVYVTLIDFKAAKASKAKYTATFEGTAPADDKKPKPVVPVPPVPPAPAVTVPPELQKAILSAWTKETEAERAKLGKLADVFASCAAIAPNYAKRADLIAAAHDIANAKIGEGSLVIVRRAIGDWLNKTVGTSDTVLTPDEVKAYVTAYRQASAALAALAN